eukprot:5420951-Prymnesium_polylepis.1
MFRLCCPVRLQSVTKTSARLGAPALSRKVVRRVAGAQAQGWSGWLRLWLAGVRALLRSAGASIAA